AIILRYSSGPHRPHVSCPTRRSSISVDCLVGRSGKSKIPGHCDRKSKVIGVCAVRQPVGGFIYRITIGRHRVEMDATAQTTPSRSEEHTSELQSREKLVCRLLLDKKK